VVVLSSILAPTYWFVNYTATAPRMCQDCHTAIPELWKSSKGHPAAEARCIDCHHGKEPYSDEGCWTMHATDKVINENCIGCHQDMLRQVLAADATRPVKTSHRYHRAEGLDCIDCHRNCAHEMQQPGTNRPYKACCYDCHLREMAWGGWKGTCIRCHYVDIGGSPIEIEKFAAE
jgi:hypothetical protein